MGQVLQAVAADPGLESHFENEGGQDRNQIGVAAALAKPVQRALNLANPGAHRGQRIRDRVFGVVVAMDAELFAGDLLHHLADDLLDFMGQRSAIGVAEHDPARPRFVSRDDASERVFRIVLIAVEEMFGVEQNFRNGLRGMGDAVADHGEVFVAADAERHVHLEIPGLADQTKRRRLAADQRGKAGIVAGGAARFAGPAEGGQLGMSEFRRIAEKRVVGRVRPRPAAFDVIEAELVELDRDRALVGGGEIDALGLPAVAQRGVIEIDAVGGLAHPARLHSVLPPGLSSRITPMAFQILCGCGRPRRSSSLYARRSRCVICDLYLLLVGEERVPCHLDMR